MESNGWRSPDPSTARIGVLGGDFPWCLLEVQQIFGASSRSVLRRQNIYTTFAVLLARRRRDSSAG